MKEKRIALVYPHHLFKAHPALALTDDFVIVEDPLFFRQYRFHKQKLAFHRASMREYAAFLETKKKRVRIIESSELPTTGAVLEHLSACREIVTCDLDDDWLSRRLKKAAAAKNIAVRELESPGFLAPLSTTLELLGDREPLFLAAFYKAQRLRTGLLVDHGKPAGGAWSHDVENRKRLPKNVKIPAFRAPRTSSLATSALESVNTEFAENPGFAERLLYPVTFTGAEAWLDEFLAARFESYGPYQDAISTGEAFLFHSVLSPLINAGLLLPGEVLRRALAVAEERAIPLSSVEGFLRQVLGWREFIRGAYHRIGVRERTRNFWGHTRKIPSSFWEGTTGIEPVDIVIRRVLDHAYAHHIERLMVLGSFMLLCEFDPDEVYRWFMELFVDAYDWVMVPNVYGMSQFADGGLMATKPYVCGSNYLRKMGDFRSGPWETIWDGLFWRFVERHRDYFAGNQRLGMMVVQLDRRDPEKSERQREAAEAFLRRLDAENAATSY